MSEYNTRPTMDTLLEAMNAGFAAIAERFDAMNDRFDRIEARLEMIEVKLSILNDRILDVEAIMKHHENRIRTLERREQA